MTFKEFFNKRDSTPFTLRLKPDNLNGLQVVKDISKDLVASQIPGNPSASIKKIMGVSGSIKPPTFMGKNLFSDRPIEKKPTNFLPRKK